MDGATIRDIAKAAGVSGGLVRHHFGSKDDLRAACDSYALDQLMQIKEQAVLDGQLANPSFMSAAHPTVLLLYRYLARSLVMARRPPRQCSTRWWNWARHGSPRTTRARWPTRAATRRCWS